MLNVVATLYAGDLIDHEAGSIGYQTTGHRHKAVIGKPVGLPDADIDHPAFPDIQYAIVRTRDRREFLDKTQSANDIELLPGELFDAKFFRINRALVDQDYPVAGVPE